MSTSTPKPIPLPCALLALSVAVCLGAVNPSHASTVQGGCKAQAQQRESLIHLLDVIQQAAKKFTDRIDGQAVVLKRPSAADDPDVRPAGPADGLERPVSRLRDALLNLPPPGC